MEITERSLWTLITRHGIRRPPICLPVLARRLDLSSLLPKSGKSHRSGR